VIETIARLRSRKAAVVESVGSQKSSLRWEPVADGHEFSRGSTTALLEATTMNEDKALEKPPMAAAAGEEAASEEYTTRLLKAKQQISRQLDRH